jgi:phosphate transport system ATP-binding protein
MPDSIFSPSTAVELEARNLSVLYGSTRAVKGVSIKVPDRKVVAFIGPSGCGKSTLLRCFNRMNDLVPGARSRVRRCSRGGTCTARRRGPGGRAPAHRHGVPEAEPVPQVHL